MQCVPQTLSRRDQPGEAAMRALLAACDESAAVLAWTAREWRSITFSGWRIDATFDFPGEAADAGQALLELAPEELRAIPGYLVADFEVVWVNRQLSPANRLTCGIRLLLLEDVSRG